MMKLLDKSRQLQTIYLVTKETKRDDEQLIVVVPSRYAFSNWLAMQGEEYNDEDADMNFNLYNKYQFKNGTTIRIIPYQLSEYEPTE